MHAKHQRAAAAAALVVSSDGDDTAARRLRHDAASVVRAKSHVAQLRHEGTISAAASARDVSESSACVVGASAAASTAI